MSSLVALVDQHDGVKRLLLMDLEGAGIKVDMYEDFDSAVQAVTTTAYRAILLNPRMRAASSRDEGVMRMLREGLRTEPDGCSAMIGLEIARRARTKGPNIQTPIISYSTYAPNAYWADDEIVEESVQRAGIETYIPLVGGFEDDPSARLLELTEQAVRRSR
jgi:CheY-like chemotaxis protein